MAPVRSHTISSFVAGSAGTCHSPVLLHGDHGTGLGGIKWERYEGLEMAGGEAKMAFPQICVDCGDVSSLIDGVRVHGHLGEAEHNAKC